MHSAALRVGAELVHAQAAREALPGWALLPAEAVVQEEVAEVAAGEEAAAGAEGNDP